MSVKFKAVTIGQNLAELTTLSGTAETTRWITTEGWWPDSAACIPKKYVLKIGANRNC